jgi:hypothetical protein
MCGFTRHLQLAIPCACCERWPHEVSPRTRCSSRAAGNRAPFLTHLVRRRFVALEKIGSEPHPPSRHLPRTSAANTVARSISFRSSLDASVSRSREQPMPHRLDRITAEIPKSARKPVRVILREKFGQLGANFGIVGIIRRGPVHETAKGRRIPAARPGYVIRALQEGSASFAGTTAERSRLRSAKAA